MKHTERQLTFHIKCQADDSAVIRVTETLRGTAYEQVKELLENATPERRRRFFEERASAVSHTGKLTGKAESSFTSHPGMLNYEIKAENFLSRTGIFRIVPLPRYGLLKSMLALPVSEKRTIPYWRNRTGQLGVRYTITPPPGFSVVPGRRERVQEGRYGSAQYSENYSALSGQVTLRCRLYLPVELVAPADFVELENMILRLSRPESDRIVFKQISGNPETNSR